MSNNINDLPLFAVSEYTVEENGIKELFHQRVSDGYISATELCKSTGKKFNNWFRLSITQAFLEQLSTETLISVSELVQVIKGGTPHLQGTWVHPQVAINLGQWLSPKFAVRVSKWVLDWMSGKQQPHTKMPYHLQRYVANLGKIPQGYFSMLNEMTQNLIAPLENQGYTLPENMIPDISEGRMFCDWLRKEKNIEPSIFPTYKHQYDDGRVVDAKLYPNIILADFRKHFYEVWIQKRSLDYFEKKDIKALPYLQKVIGLLENIKIEPYKLENKEHKLDNNKKTPQDNGSRAKYQWSIVEDTKDINPEIKQIIEYQDKIDKQQKNPTSEQFIKNIQADSVDINENNDFESNIRKIIKYKK